MPDGAKQEILYVHIAQHLVGCGGIGAVVLA